MKFLYITRRCLCPQVGRRLRRLGRRSVLRRCRRVVRPQGTHDPGRSRDHLRWVHRPTDHRPASDPCVRTQLGHARPYCAELVASQCYWLVVGLTAIGCRS